MEEKQIETNPQEAVADPVEQAALAAAGMAPAKGGFWSRMKRLTPRGALPVDVIVARIRRIIETPPDKARLKKDGDIVARKFWDKLRSNMGRFPFAEDVVAAYYCTIDPETPLKTKAVIVSALVYFITPIDIVPDIVPTGLIDDGMILAGILAWVKDDITEAHYGKARAFLLKPALEKAEPET